MFHVFLALGSCCTNVASLEILFRDIPACGNVITFFQFLFIAIEGFIFTSKFGTVKPCIPIKKYIILVSLVFTNSLSNNFALNFDISMPLHMIFKSGSLVTNMLLGMLLLKKRYTFRKYVSVLMVTCGICLTTWASHSIKVDEVHHHKPPSVIGILLLSISLIVSSFLGIFQEDLFKTYGRHSKEAVFYSHTFSLPGFLFVAKDISSKIPLFSASEPVQILAFSIPKLWIWLLANVFMQYVCTISIFSISTKFSSLTVTMVLTLRKFLSLLFSVIYFQNPFTLYHWLGTFLVFGGSFLFADFKSSKTKTQ